MLLPPTETERQRVVRTVFGQALADQANSSRFDAYFNHYCSVVCPAASGDAVIEFDSLALRSHADVLSCVDIIVQEPEITFRAFAAKAIEGKSENASPREKQHIARVVTQVAFAVNCMLRDYHSDNFTVGGSRHAKWEEDVPFLDFIENAFKLESQPTQTPPEPQPQQLTRRAETIVAHKSTLKAWKLTKRYGIMIKGTDNLLEHLALDRETKTLKVFHQVSFLRAHLLKSRDQPLDLGFEESLRRGTLPPRLLLETLLTFHDVLFPVASVLDKKSHAALETMIQKHGFDAEGRLIQFVRDTPPDMAFDYWGSRLSVLHDVVKQRPPSNAIVAWFERHTSERNALTVAIVGLLLSALFGLLSFIVGLLQLALAWVAYKYPPASGPPAPGP